MCVGFGSSVSPIDAEMGTWVYSKREGGCWLLPLVFVPKRFEIKEDRVGIGFRESIRVLAALSESALPLFDHLEPCAPERVGSFSCGLEELFSRFIVDELLTAVGVTFPAPVEETAMELENCFAGCVEPVHRGALNPSFSFVPVPRVNV